MDNDFDDFCERFDALMTEANEHGLRTVVVVYEDDPLANVESKNLLWKGGPLLAAGMAGWAQNHLMMRSNEHED